MIPLEPLHPVLVEYRAEVEAVLARPARAARLAELEAMSRATRSEEEYRAVGARIVALLDEVHDEVDAARRAAGKRVPWRSGQPWPSSSGQSSGGRVVPRSAEG
jgi:anti-sigma factor RsiW